MRDATYILDGLLYHESDLRIEEHYTDTSGFTDHVFAMMHRLGFRFVPRIGDLPDKHLFMSCRPSNNPAIKVIIGGTINAKRIALSGARNTIEFTNVAFTSTVTSKVDGACYSAPGRYVGTSVVVHCRAPMVARSRPLQP